MTRRFAAPWAVLIAAAVVAATASVARSDDLKIDPVHSFAIFSVHHFQAGYVYGTFAGPSGQITYDPANPEASSFDVKVDVDTLDTRNKNRDKDLKGPDFFNVTQFPTMTYRGNGIRRVPDGAWIMDGALTIRGISKVVPMRFRFKGIFRDMPAGAPARAAFHGTAATKRADFGMIRDNVAELGVPPAPGEDVEIQIDVEANANPPRK